MYSESLKSFPKMVPEAEGLQVPTEDKILIYWVFWSWMLGRETF